MAGRRANKKRTKTTRLNCVIEVPEAGAISKDQFATSYLKGGASVRTMKRPKMSKTSIVRGKRFEAEMARRLSLWWSGGTDEFVFSSRSRSGGMGRDKRGGTGHAGDLFADKPAGAPFTELFVCECKYHETLGTENHLVQLATGSVSKLIESFLKQVQADAGIYGRQYILFLRWNRQQPVLLTNSVTLGVGTQGARLALPGLPWHWLSSVCALEQLSPALFLPQQRRFQQPERI